MNFFKNILAWSFLPLQAYDRRGQARVELQNLSGALADFEKAKEFIELAYGMNPENSIINNAVEALSVAEEKNEDHSNTLEN